MVRCGRIILSTNIEATYEEMVLPLPGRYFDGAYRVPETEVDFSYEAICRKSKPYELKENHKDKSYFRQTTSSMPFPK